MTTEVRLVKYIAPNSKKFDNTPVTIEWKGERMVKNHSLRVVARELLTLSESLDVCKLSLIGSPSTGKTTCMKSLMHLCHQLSPIPFSIKILDRHNLLDFEATLAKLEPANYLIGFDDVSFLGANANKKQVEIVKAAFTSIRHLPGGQDVKIIAFFSYHYSLGLDKYLRTNNASIFTDIGNSDYTNIQKELGMQNTGAINNFKTLHQMCLLKKKWAVRLGKSKIFVYRYRMPFSPALYWNGMSARIIAYPKREWIDPICSVCVHGETGILKDGLNIEDLAKQLESKFGPQLARNAIRIKLFSNGVNVYPKRQRQAMAFIDKYMENKIVNMNLLADHYKFNNDPTRLDAKIDGIEAV